MQRTIAIADALASALTEHKFPARRGYLPEVVRTKDTQIVITPRADVMSAAGRGQTDHEHTLNVIVLRDVRPGDLDDCDAVVNAAAAVAALFSDSTGALREVDMAEAEFKSVSHDPLFVPETLRQHNQLWSVLTLTYTYQP